MPLTTDSVTQGTLASAFAELRSRTGGELDIVARFPEGCVRISQFRELR